MKGSLLALGSTSLPTLHTPFPSSFHCQTLPPTLHKRSPFADQGASWSDLEEVYDPMADAGQLPVRVYAFVPLEQWGALATRVAARGFSHPSGRLHAGGAKAFADGSLGSRTALLRAPYADAPGQTGVRMSDPARLRRDALAADAAGLQVAIHAIGDLAVDEVLDIFDEAAAKNGDRSRPAWRAMRVEHAQHIGGRATAARFGALAAAVVAVANPQHLITDAPMLLPRLGAERGAADHAFAWPLLAAAGARVAAGSDWPVVDAQPFQGVAAAVARAKELAAFSGAPGGAAAAPSHAQLVEEALRMHTAAGADAAFVMGAAVGRLAPGRRADFVVLAGSPLKGDVAAARVTKTYVDGRCAFGCGGA